MEAGKKVKESRFTNHKSQAMRQNPHSPFKPDLRLFK